MKIWNQRALILFVAALMWVAGVYGEPGTPKGKTFATPEAAVDAFIAALRDYHLETLKAIFGPDADRLFVSEDPVADGNQRKQFLDLYDQSHALNASDEASRTLVVGKDPWPLPMPLVKTAHGWAFDTVEGIEQIIDRRVGRNELSAIQTCLAVGDAEREYYWRDRDGDGILEYAQKFRSTPGLEDGLFWPVEDGEPLSPIGEFVAAAAAEGYGPADNTYHGYQYKLLTSQGAAAPGGAYDYVVRGNEVGGFAVVAYPAAYGDSGVMTFMLSHAGVVYQKDLGEATEEAVRNMTAFNPEGWTKVDQKDLETIPDA